VEGREKIEISGSERRNHHRIRGQGYETTKVKSGELRNLRKAD
jgi:hypothetical protein